MQEEKNRRNTHPVYYDTSGIVPSKVIGSFVGIDGNAFMLMGYFQKLARIQGFSKEWVNGVLNEAKSKDYNHLVATLLDNMEVEDDDREEDY